MTATTTYPTNTRTRSHAALFSGPAGVTEHATPPALIAGEDVDAISMPAAFAALVQAELGIMMLAGPVIADEDGSWIFLTQRADTRRVPTDLLPLGVRAVPAGAALATADGSAGSPEIWWTVIGAARRVAHRISRAA